MCNEIWETIPNFDGYEVSNLGRIKSFKKYSDGKILSTELNRDGYLRVGLVIDGKRKHYKVHRLVAQAFIPNPENKPEVNHINGIKTDNRVENLEWATRSENQRHAYDTGLIVAPQGEEHHSAKLAAADVICIRDNTEHLTVCELARQFGVNENTISRIQRGKNYRTTGGKVRESKIKRVPGEIRAEIRRLYVKGKRSCGAPALAEKFGVDQKTIRTIIHETD